MSRIGKKPIPIPEGVAVSVAGETVKVKGPRGELEQKIPEGITVALEDGQIVVRRRDDDKRRRALHGLTRALLANLVEGVSRGFEKTLEIQGTGYRAAKSGKKLVLSLGYSRPVEVEPPAGIEIEVPQPTTVVVRGASKELVGQVAAYIRSLREVEPYLGKGIRYAGEKVRRKAGKAGRK